MILTELPPLNYTSSLKGIQVFDSKNKKILGTICVYRLIRYTMLIYRLRHSISCKFAWAPNEDSDQPAHLRSLIRVFARRSAGSQKSEAS